MTRAQAVAELQAAQAQALRIQAQNAAQLEQNRKLTDFMDKVLTEDAKSWPSSTYVQGSVRNPYMLATKPGRDFGVTSDYQYADGWGNVTTSSVTVFVEDAKIKCLTYATSSDSCDKLGTQNVPGSGTIAVLTALAVLAAVGAASSNSSDPDTGSSGDTSIVGDFQGCEGGRTYSLANGHTLQCWGHSGGSGVSPTVTTSGGVSVGGLSVPADVK